MAEKIDLNTLPKGLTKEEFTALPNFKKIRSFFTWAGVVSIGSGILICSEIGKTAESVFQAGGSYDDMSKESYYKRLLPFYQQIIDSYK